MLPLFLCSLVHNFIAAFYNKHTGTLHRRVCAVIRFQLLFQTAAGSFKKAATFSFQFSLSLEATPGILGQKEKQSTQIKRFSVCLHFYGRRAFEPHPGRFSLEPTTVLRYGYIQAASSSPTRPARTHVLSMRSTQPNLPPTATATSQHLCLPLLHLQHSLSCPRPLSFFWTWLAQYVGYLVFSISVMGSAVLTVDLFSNPQTPPVHVWW